MAKIVIAKLMDKSELVGYRTIDNQNNVVQDYRTDELKAVMKADVAQVGNAELNALGKVEIKEATVGADAEFPELRKDRNGEYTVMNKGCKNYIFALAFSTATVKKLEFSGVVKACNCKGEVGLMANITVEELVDKKKITLYGSKEDGSFSDWVHDSFGKGQWSSIAHEDARSYMRRSQALKSPFLQCVNSCENPEVVMAVGVSEPPAQGLLIIPEWVGYIGPYALASVKGLSKIVFGENIVKLYEGALEWLVGLQIKLNDGLEEIGEYVFRGSTFSEKLEIPSSVKKISKTAFKWCTIRDISIQPGALEESDAGMGWLTDNSGDDTTQPHNVTLTIKEELAARLLRYYGTVIATDTVKNDAEDEEEKKSLKGAILESYGEGALESISTVCEMQADPQCGVLKVPVDKATSTLTLLMNAKGRWLGELRIR